MINNVELFINEPVNARLDISNEVKVSLQYSIADIKDISKRNSAFSKTIILPATKNNNYWFGNLFDVNADFSSFNPNKKTPAKLLVNTSVVIDGFLQLRKIKKLANVDPEGNYILYEIVIYNNTVDLMSILGENKLNQLDLNSYNHTYNYDNITGSWTNTWEDGYVYPLYGLGGDESTTPIYQTTGDLTNKLYPAFFYKTLLNEIIGQAGFGWTGSLATNEQFEKEIIPYVGDGLPKITLQEQQRRQFSARSSGATYSTADFPSSSNGSSPPYALNIYPFNVDTGTDPYEHWNTTTSSWEVDRNGVYHIDYAANFDVNITNNTGYTTAIVAANPTLIVAISVQRQATGSSLWETLDTHYPTGENGALLYGVSNGTTQTVNVLTNKITPELSLNIGDKVRIIVRLSKAGGSFRINGPSGFELVDQDSQIVFNEGENYIRNYAYMNSITDGDIVDWASTLSDKIKQKDLITDLIKRYNLYIRIDPENQRNLILDTRTDFYSSNTDILDWTKKKDFSKEDSIEMLSEIQAKEMLFTFKADNSDALNALYTNQTGDIFGQYSYIFDNDFVKGVKKIETIFSPTALAKTSFNAITPALDPAKPKGSPRVLIYGGLKACNAWSFNYLDGTTPTTSTFTLYPYAGYYDDPIQPNLNNMFGNPKYEFYTGRTTTTTNTMYNRYWFDYIKQIEEGKLITSYFYLTEKDIAYVKDNLNVKIFVKDSYYYINKIIDYNGLENAITKVELLKIRDGITWVEQNEGAISGGEDCPDDVYIYFEGTKRYYGSDTGTITEDCCDALLGVWNADTETCQVRFSSEPADGSGDIGSYNADNTKSSVINNTGVLPGDIVSGINNIVGGTYLYSPTGDPADNIILRNSAVVVGNNNNALSNETLIVGDNNISSDKSFIIGNNNIVEASKAVVLSSEGTTVKSNSVVIGAKGITASENNKILLGNEFNIDTETGDIFWRGKEVVIPINDEVIKTTKVRIEPARILTLFSRPVILVPAPDPGQYIDILSVTMKMDYKSVNYTADTTLTVWYDTALQNLFRGDNFLDVSRSGLYRFNQTDASPKDIQIVEGKSVYLTTTTQNPLNGDSTIEIITSYRVVGDAATGWVLTTGNWDDTGEWIDTATWVD